MFYINYFSNKIDSIFGFSLQKNKITDVANLDMGKAMDQITNFNVFVKIKRLEQHEIDMYSR